MTTSKQKPRVKRQRTPHVSLELVHRLRGKFKGKGLLKALMAEKQKERNS